MVAKKPKAGSKQAGKSTSKSTNKPKPKPPIVNMETADTPAFNTFTKSYRTRYVVHASRHGDERTVCGRHIESRSDELFDSDVPGACLKCIQKMAIEKRIHPGWVG